MPSLVPSFHKPLTTPCTAAALPVALSELLNHVALFDCPIEWSASDTVVTILHYPAFASTLLGCISTAKALPIGAADHTCFISMVNLAFANQANFPHIAEQQGLFNTLSSLTQSKILDQSIGDTSAPAKAFFTFANAIIAIQGHCCEACQKELQETDPKGKPHAKKIKVLSSVTSHKVGSEAALALLSQVYAALAEDDSSVSCADLQKHCDAIDLDVQQQLYALNLLL
ncbi:hypothetical protein E4T56_gene2257 [Termitomyces sp. T112]|nr:hypothetical protein E4T56_gene2257 [Termitomyces sp. T112]